MDGEDGEEDADDVDAVMVVGAPEIVGGVGVRVLIPEVSEAGDTTRRDLRLPFCWFNEVELMDGVDCVVAAGLTEAGTVVVTVVPLLACMFELAIS
jgi:hypothetical protein